MSKFKNVIELCRKTGYLTPTGAGPLGTLLAENLRSEWLHNCLNERGLNMMLASPGSLENSLTYAQKLGGDKEHFSLAHITLDTNNGMLKGFEESFEFNSEHQLSLKTYTFVSASVAQQFFYSQQKNRRIWWRKISTDPSRYSLTDPQVDENSGREYIQIVSKFPWNTNIIEEIFLEPVESTPKVHVKEGRKKVESRCITTTTHLTTMLLNTLCDSYSSEKGVGNGKRELFRLHRCLAPLKIAIVTSGQDNVEDVKDLAQYIRNKLKKNGLPVLISSSCDTVENQFIKNDQLGIPYTILLDDSTLKNGITYLRNRDTTLKEEIHVGQLIQYIKLLLKNY